MRKVWWAAAPVAVAAMVAASAQPYFSVIRPWSWSQERVVEPGASAEFAFPIHGAGDITRDAEVSVVGFQQVPESDFQALTISPPEGFNMWIVLTQWHAPQDSPLSYCRVWATGTDGREYLLSDRVFSTEPILPVISNSKSCTPAENSGPYFDGAQLVDGFGDPRPDEWQKLTPIAMPAGVQPAKLHFGWDEPNYVTLVLPEPEVFVTPGES